MTALNFPSSPTLGQIYTANGGTWEWDGTTWVSKNILDTSLGGTGQATYSNGQLLIGKTDGTLAKATLTAGTGVSVTNGDGSVTVTNSAPDQTVALTAGTGISTSGTYPNFTITNSAPDQTVALTAGTGISTSGTYPNFTITNASPDQTVSLTGAGTTAITGTYPNFTITSNDQFAGTVTSVNVSGGTTGLTFSGGPVTTSGTITMAGTLGVANGGTGTATALTAGSVVFAGASGVYSQDNANLFWDDTNNRLGIGTSSPSQRLDVNGNLNVSGSGQFTAATYCLVGVTSGTVQGQFAANSGGSVDIRAVSNHAMNFFTNNTNRMRIDSAGNVGIGTSSPGAKLQINAQDGFRFDVEAGAASTMRFGSAFTGEGTGALAFSRSTGAITLSNGASGSALVERMQIDASGNVGIGTTPVQQNGRTLQVDGGAGAADYRLTNNTTGAGFNNGGLYSLIGVDNYLWNLEAGFLSFGTSNAERMRITAAGDVGIGTSSPGARLDVAGNANFGPLITTGTGASTGDVMIEVGGNRAGTGNAYIDLHATAGTDFEARVIRVAGANGIMEINNTGTGGMVLNNSGAAAMSFQTSATERMRITAAGDVGIGNISPGYKLSVSGTAELTAAKEGVFTITDGGTVNLDPNNGSIQTWTLGANRTPDQANWATGQSITLQVDDGTAYTITWTTLAVVWTTDGGSAPSLNTTGVTNIVLWKVGTTIYGARVGDA